MGGRPGLEDRAAEKYRDGEVVGFENVSTVTGTDFAYTVEIESYRARVGRAEEMAPVALRVTSVFRREDAVWKAVRRHADPITSARPAESVVQT
jgi:ketosteroid isomerase-like protein